MSMPKALPPPNTRIQDTLLGMGPEWQRWLQDLLLELHKSLCPPKGIIPCNLTAADIAAEFDATGLGRAGGPYEWWAICNGLNDTPDLTDLYIKHSNATAGTASGSFTTSASSAANTGGSGILTTGAPSAITKFTAGPTAGA
jgi:hypothetical protein